MDEELMGAADQAADDAITEAVAAEELAEDAMVDAEASEILAEAAEESE